MAAIADRLVQMLTGTYPNPLMYHPQALRQRAIEAFGPQAFQRVLSAHLVEQLNLATTPMKNEADQLHPA